jgi:DNA-binding XRE family transcriptional regulator
MWPFGNDNNGIANNQQMVGKLLETQKAREALSTTEKRSMQALGIEVAQLREEAGMTLSDAMQVTGLDKGFICILENGHVLPNEITDDVLIALACGLAGQYKAVDATLYDLEQAMMA